MTTDREALFARVEEHARDSDAAADIHGLRKPMDTINDRLADQRITLWRTRAADLRALLALARTPPKDAGQMADPVKMPARIWAWDNHEGFSYSLAESTWARHRYVRADLAIPPELAALNAAIDRHNARPSLTNEGAVQWALDDYITARAKEAQNK